MGKKLSFEESVRRAASLNSHAFIAALRKLQAAGELPENGWETIIVLVAREAFVNGAAFAATAMLRTMTDKEVLRRIASGGNAYSLRAVDLTKKREDERHEE